MTDHKNLKVAGTKAFFKYARARYGIMLFKNAGAPLPWSNDPIFQQFRFCNVFREDDTTTRFIRKTITDVAGYGDRVLQATIIARWFNRISTIEIFVGKGDEANLLRDWDTIEARRRLQGIAPYITAAYMVATKTGMNKMDGIFWALEHILPDVVHLQARIEPGETTLREVHAVLMEYPYIGAFGAYEVVTDLRHTDLLRDAPDIMTWANPGPGAARGVGRVVGAGPDAYRRSARANQDYFQKIMMDLLAASADPRYWPEDWPQWEMRDVEHTLCEFDKYERSRLGQGRPKQRYNGEGASE